MFVLVVYHFHARPSQIPLPTGLDVQLHTSSSPDRLASLRVSAGPPPMYNLPIVPGPVAFIPPPPGVLPWDPHHPVPGANETVQAGAVLTQVCVLHLPA